MPEWGVRLNTAQPVGDGVVAVGIRAHYFNVKSTRNRYPIVYAGEMEEPFEWTVRFRFAGQDETSEALWWRVTKDKRPQEFPEEIWRCSEQYFAFVCLMAFPWADFAI